MALADLLDGYIAKQTSGCSFQKLIDTLSEKDKIALQSAMDKGVPGSVVIHALKSEGHKTSNDSFYRHYKGMCKCPKNE